MFTVEWIETALKELARNWMNADPQLRSDITHASNRIDIEALLEADPFSESEGCTLGTYVLLVAPLGVEFRLESDGSTITVYRVWVFSVKGHQGNNGD